MSWFQCSDNYEGGSDTTGISRLDNISEDGVTFSSILALRKFITFILFFIVYRLNKSILQSGRNAIFGSFLILPSYFEFINSYLAYGAAETIVLFTVALFFAGSNLDAGRKKPYYLAFLTLDLTIIHIFEDGLAVYFMQYSAGKEAFATALRRGFKISILYSIFCSTTCILHALFPLNSSAFIVYSMYRLTWFFTYTSIALVPLDYVYRRPAFQYFAFLNMLNQILRLTESLLRYFDLPYFHCIVTFNTLVLDGIINPIVILWCLSYDSKVRIYKYIYIYICNFIYHHFISCIYCAFFYCTSIGRGCSNKN